jgi:hypothetical protein
MLWTLALVAYSNYLALAPAYALFFLLRHDVLNSLPNTHLPPTDNPLFTTDFLTARLTALKVLGKYLALLVWPWPLSADYSYNQIPPVHGRRLAVARGVRRGDRAGRLRLAVEPSGILLRYVRLRGTGADTPRPQASAMP